MGTFLLTLVTTLLALTLVPPRRRSAVDVPVDGGRVDGPGRRRAGVAAVVPADDSPAVQGIICRLLQHVDRIVVVHEPGAGRRLADFRAHPCIDVLQAPDGAGTVMARARCAGVRHAIERHAPRAVLIVEPDVGPAVELVPEFLAELTGHDAVVGTRLNSTSPMSAARRFGARVVAALLGAVLRRPVPDARCGMRLFSIEALRRVPLSAGGCASDVGHLKAMLAHGLDVVWLPVPAGRRSRRSCSPLRQALAVPTAILAPVGVRAPDRGFWRTWTLRLAAAAAAALVLALVVPVLRPVDEALFTLINARIGDGPDWVFAVLDPHHRNYALVVLVATVAAAVSGRARAVGTVLALAAAGTAAYAVLEIVNSISVRPRPEEVLAASEIRRAHRSWADYASLPSGHATVTIALAVAAAMVVPALRVPAVAYAAIISWSRIAFGAHFPLDVVASAVLGVPCAAFGVALARATGILQPLAPARAPQHPHQRPSR